MSPPRKKPRPAVIRAAAFQNNFDANSNAATFQSAIIAAGLFPPDHIEPGRLHRFPGADKSPGNTAGWCRLFDDRAGGVFGDWSTGLSEVWIKPYEGKQSTAERQVLQARIAEARHQAESERAVMHADAVEKAATIWNQALPAVGHVYLSAKGIKAHGTRIHGDALLIPLRDKDGTLRSLQFIDTDGGKRFLAGGKVQGCYFSLGGPGSVICIAEGFATAASVHEATTLPVAVAFNAGNLQPVAEALRLKFPNAKLIICGDNDESQTGQKAAKEAAVAVQGLTAIPPARGDWNDLAQAQGLAHVQKFITRAYVPVFFRRLSDVEAVPIDWLWQGRIARGKVTMIAGAPGLGKSQISASACAIVTTGGVWPVDRTKAPRGSAIILSAEDDAADTIKPRLQAAGADTTRCYVLDAIADGENERSFNLATDLQRLGQLMEQIGDVALVIIDPVSAYLGSVDSHKNSEVRALLAPLGQLAAKHRAAIVCVSHLNKANGQDALSRVTGSLAFVAAARAAFIVSKDPSDESRRLFLPAKNNIGPDSTGLAFHIESAFVGSIETSRIVWHSEAVSLSADDALAATYDNESRTEKEEAADFLQQALQGGPVKAQDVTREAKAAGISTATLRRAKKDVGVRSTKCGAEWQWFLQGAHVPSQKVSTLSTFRQDVDSQAFFPTEDDQDAQGAQHAHTAGGEHVDEEEF